MKLAFRFDGDAWNLFRWSLDDMIIEPVYVENDLEAVSISGSTTPSVGVESVYNVKVKNIGAAMQNEYTVALITEGGLELASVPGVPIGFAETVTFELPWTPQFEGATNIYGLITFPGDENPANNQTEPLNVMVYPSDLLVVKIGDGSFLSNTPYSFARRGSISQTIYFPEEIGFNSGKITAIQYVNNFGTAKLDIPIQIWIGETSLNDLQGGWVAPALLQPVFNGTVDFPAGINEIFIQLDEAYEYGGGNLLIYNAKQDNTTQFGHSFYNTQQANSRRTREREGNLNATNPLNPSGGAVQSRFPNITIFFSESAVLEPGDGTVTDIDGNVYQTVIIGNQEWMAENLRVTRYNNEDNIPTDLSNAAWSSTTSGAYAIYNNNTNMLQAYGRLYNWYAVDDPRGLCPEGWSVPSDADWTALVDYVVSEGFPNESNNPNGAANALKSCRQVNSPLGGACNTSTHPRWDSHGTHYGSDEFGFSALPGGRRVANGNYFSIGETGRWWSSSEDSPTSAWLRGMSSSDGDVSRNNPNKRVGFSIRCFRDVPANLEGTVTNSIGAPIEGAEVAVTIADAQTATDADGFYELELIAGTFDVSFSKFGFDVVLVEDFEVLPGVTNVLNVALTEATPYTLPFIERWNSGTFAEQRWNAGNSNWVVSDAAGNPKPAAMFNRAPQVTDYEHLLSSYYIDCAGVSDISIQFDVLLSNQSTSTTEQLIVKLYDGVDWFEVISLDNQGGNIPWTTFNVDISDFAVDNLFYIAFFATGQDSWNINHWYVDNIYVVSGGIQKVMLPGANSWGYISSFIHETAKVSLEETLSTILDVMTIMIGTDGFFWPGQNINTLGSWDTHKGYKIRMTEGGELTLLGSVVEDKTVTFNPGAQIIPVLSENPISADLLFDGHDIMFAFDLNGAIYWPAGGIFTLNTLYPGYGYLVMFNQTTTLDFNLSKHQTVPNIMADYENTTPWNDVLKTGDVHIVGISREAAAILGSGDVVGVFNSDGLCTGLAISGNPGQAITIAVYGTDMTTEATDGMIHNEPMQFRLFSNGEVIPLEPVYSNKAPHSDGGFAVNGFSLITDLKAGSAGVDANLTGGIRINPNPTTGLLFINGFEGAIDLEIINAQGRIVFKDQNFTRGQVDLDGNAPGIYFVRYIIADQVNIEKIILK